MKKRDLKYPSTAVNLQYCTQVSVIRTTVRPQIICEKKLWISYNDYRQDSCARNRLQGMRTVKQKSRETCENVPPAAIMCKVCVIINIVEKGELKIDRCSAEISESLKKKSIWLPCRCYTL